MKAFHVVFFILSLLVVSPFLLENIIAQEEALVVDSEYAEYSGKQISLSGNVTIEHELGTITAHSVDLIPEMDAEKKRSYNLNLLGNVKIVLKDSGELNCARADVNYTAKFGIFHNSPEQEFVIYTEYCPDKAGGSVPLVVKSREMKVQIGKTSDKTTPSHSCLSDIIANEDVTVDYNRDFTAYANQATYHRSNEDSLKSTLPGLITLSANEGSADENKNGICQVTNRNGDIIKASLICIDTTKRHILFAYPQGTLHAKKSPNLKQEPITFSSDALIWDDAQSILTLRDHVTIIQNGLGTLTTDDQIQLFQQQINDTKQLRAIESTGKTILVYESSDKKLSHTLTCYGKALVDHEHYKTVMDSPRDDQGNVIEGKQVFLHDDMGDIYADRVTIYYNISDQNFITSKIVLEGHVYILNRGAVDPEKTKAFLEYAIADTVEYAPQANEIYMSAAGKKRVLFFDRVNNLQVSAPALKIRRDQTTNKDSIQGMGDVRFSFMKREIEEIEKHFHLLVDDKEKKKTSEGS